MLNRQETIQAIGRALRSLPDVPTYLFGSSARGDYKDSSMNQKLDPASREPIIIFRIEKCETYIRKPLLWQRMDFSTVLSMIILWLLLNGFSLIN